MNITPRNVEELSTIFKARYPSLDDWKLLDPWVKGLPREENGADILNQIRRRTESFRDSEMANIILSNLSGNNRVLVVTGANHMGALIPMLRR